MIESGRSYGTALRWIFSTRAQAEQFMRGNRDANRRLGRHFRYRILKRGSLYELWRTPVYGGGR